MTRIIQKMQPRSVDLWPRRCAPAKNLTRKPLVFFGISIAVCHIFYYILSRSREMSADSFSNASPNNLPDIVSHQFPYGEVGKCTWYMISDTSIMHCLAIFLFLVSTIQQINRWFESGKELHLQDTQKWWHEKTLVAEETWFKQPMAMSGMLAWEWM